MQRQSLPASQQRTIAVKGKLHSRENFLAAYNPAFQRQICTDTEECFFGDYPTLSQLKAAIGDNAPVMWLIPQLYDLSEYCGVRDKLQGSPLEECAFVIASTFYFLKVSELMLFFFRFKQGYYGRFYGKIDPLVITTALHNFAKERSQAICKRETIQQEQMAQQAKQNAISWEEYCKLTGQVGRPHPLYRNKL